MDKEEKIEEILGPWKDLLVEGIQHRNIGTSRPHEFSS